jgi:hypothetical protein
MMNTPFEGFEGFDDQFAAQKATSLSSAPVQP